MKAKDYRRQLESELSQETESDVASLGLDELRSLLSDTSESTERRTWAVEQCEPTSEAEFDDLVSLCLATLDNEKELVTIRKAALGKLKFLTFMSTSFYQHSGIFREVLQRLALSKSSTLRYLALEYLSHEHDGFATDLLLAGLRGEEALPVSEEAAIRFVGEDEHSEAASLIRSRFDHLTTMRAKLEAAQALSSDPTSAQMLADVVVVKSNPASLRQACLSSVQNSDPERFQAIAQQLVLDEEESNGIRAAALSGLAAKRLSKEVSDDTRFTEQVGNIKSRSRNVQSAKHQYLKTTFD